MEIHIQLNTRRKLFCHCPPVLRDDEPHFRLERRLHISLSELRRKLSVDFRIEPR